MIEVTKGEGRTVGRCLYENDYVVVSDEPITREILSGLRKENKLGYGQGYTFKARPLSLCLPGQEYQVVVTDHIDSSD